MSIGNDSRLSVVRHDWSVHFASTALNFCALRLVSQCVNEWRSWLILAWGESVFFSRLLKLFLQWTVYFPWRCKRSLCLISDNTMAKAYTDLNGYQIRISPLSGTYRPWGPRGMGWACLLPPLLVWIGDVAIATVHSLVVSSHRIKHMSLSLVIEGRLRMCPQVFGTPFFMFCSRLSSWRDRLFPRGHCKIIFTITHS